MFLPCFKAVFSGQVVNKLLADKMLLYFSCWIFLSLAITHDFNKSLESGGIQVLESFGSYLIARRYIVNDFDFRCLVKLLIFTVFALSIFTIPESLTGRNLIRPHIPHIDPRMGLNRAFGPFEHAILYGVFCASIFSMSLYVPTSPTNKSNTSRTIWVFIATLMSVSSGALAAAIIQLLLTAWEKMTSTLSSRWKVLSFILLNIYILIDLLSTRTPLTVLLHRLTFSAHTAYNRMTIWEWGTRHNVAQHPWFGIGFHIWTRPSWMHSTSMDNFWLVIMVRYGLPAFFFLSYAIFLLFYKAGTNKDLHEGYLAKIRFGWLFSMTGFIISGWTVHFWNNLYIWFFFLLGSGAWLSFTHSPEEHGTEEKPKIIG